MIDPPPARLSAGMPYLQPRKTPFEVDVHRQVPDRFARRHRVVVVAVHDPGVVEQDVQLAIRLLRDADHVFAIGGLGDVGVNVACLAALLLGQCDRFVPGRIVHVHDDDLGAFERQTRMPSPVQCRCPRP